MGLNKVGLEVRRVHLDNRVGLSMEAWMGRVEMEDNLVLHKEVQLEGTVGQNKEA